MAVLKILQYPDEGLRRIAAPVERLDDGVSQLVADLLETTYASGAVGLAATQVNIHRHVMVIDTSTQHDRPQVFINPKIIDYRGQEKFTEGCMSLPDCWIEIERHAWIKVQAMDEKGNMFICTADGLLGECIQHEIDHLQGKLLIDYLSPLKQARVIKKLKKYSR